MSLKVYLDAALAPTATVDDRKLLYLALTYNPDVSKCPPTREPVTVDGYLLTPVEKDVYSTFDGEILYTELVDVVITKAEAIE